MSSGTPPWDKPRRDPEEIIGRAIMNLPPGLRTADPNDGIKRLREVTEEQRRIIADLRQRDVSALRGFAWGNLTGLCILIAVLGFVSWFLDIAWVPTSRTLFK